jgi:hypothetical protein
MPGGKGNIKPEDGRQFSKDYQPEEKWTEAVALNLANELIAWQKENPANIFWDEFMVIEKGIHPKTINYLSKKFTSFSTLIDQAKKIQEIKLKKYGTADKLNASMTKFVLINNHNWREQAHIDHTTDGKAFNNLSDAELVARIHNLLKPGSEG